jgi:hypothetical protein
LPGTSAIITFPAAVAEDVVTPATLWQKEWLFKSSQLFPNARGLPSGMGFMV